MLADRLTAQQLSGPRAAFPEAAVERILAVQGQDQRGFRLAVRARSAGLAAADVDAALTDRRSLLVTWLNRGTLHLVRSEDYWWLHPLTAPQLAAGSVRRLAEEGVSPAQAERGIEVVVEQVSEHGPTTKEELRSALDGVGVPCARQALTHVCYAASLRGLVVRGPVRGGEHCYVAVEDWLGPGPEPLDETDALARLARRYLAGHGPAGARDLATWAGISLGRARAGLAAISDELVEHVDGLLDLAERASVAPLPSPKLLGSFDPVLHGWKSRDFVVGPYLGSLVAGGIFRPFALVEGRAVATWGLSGGQVTLRPLERVARAVRTALEEDALDVLRFFGLPPRPLVVDR